MPPSLIHPHTPTHIHKRLTTLPLTGLQEDFLTCKRQRMEGWLQVAGLMLKTIAVDSGLLDAAGKHPAAVRPPPAWAAASA